MGLESMTVCENSISGIYGIVIKIKKRGSAVISIHGVANLFLALCLTACTIICSQPAQAFSTYSFFGGRRHMLITRDALSAIGLDKKAIHRIDKGNKHQDNVFAAVFLKADHHFDDCNLDQSKAYIDKCYKDIALLVPRAEINRSARKEILERFGKLLHVCQDFYSHSNWVELSLKADPMLTPETIGTVDWSVVANKNISSTQPSVRTGYFYYAGPLKNEKLGMSRTKSIARLCASKRMIPHTAYVKQEEYEKCKTFDERLDFATNPAHCFLHRDLNKDNPSHDEGRATSPTTKANLFEYSRHAAMKETQSQWHRLEKTVRDSGAKDPGQLIAKLRSGA